MFMYFSSEPTRARKKHFPLLAIQTTAAAKRFTVLLPFDDLPTIEKYILSHITDNRGDRHMVMLLNLTSPSVRDEKRISIQTLVKIIGKHNCKLVIAVSSSVRVFTMLAAREATTLNYFLEVSNSHFKRLTMKQLRNFFSQWASPLMWRIY